MASLRVFSGLFAAAIFVLFTVKIAVAQSFDCSSCTGGASASVCCACCVGGVLQPLVCNAIVYAPCFPAVTPSVSQTSTFSAQSTASSTPTAAPSTNFPTRAHTYAISDTSADFSYWSVPVGVRNITVRIWGAGGRAWANSISLTTQAGGGAYIEGIAFVTPGETLQITVGANDGQVSPQTGYSAHSGCGDWYGWGWGYTGGGFSAIARANAFDSFAPWAFIALAGGGGGSSSAAGGQATTGGAVAPANASTCGVFTPGGQYGCCPEGGVDCMGAGGSGWIGGSNGYSGTGGTSCAPSLENFFSASATAGFPYGMASPAWSYLITSPGTGQSCWNDAFGNKNCNWGGDGMVVLEWDGGDATPTATAARTPSATISPSMTATVTASSTHTAQVTSSQSASASLSPFCNPYVYVRYPTYDLVGTPAGAFSMQFTERSCQLQCCNSPGCTSYVFGSLQLDMGSTSGPCFLLMNATTLIPSHVMSSGVLARLSPTLPPT